MVVIVPNEDDEEHEGVLCCVVLCCVSICMRAVLASLLYRIGLTISLSRCWVCVCVCV